MASILSRPQCDIDGLVQVCSNSSVLAMESMQSCAKLLIYTSPGSHLLMWIKFNPNMDKYSGGQ